MIQTENSDFSNLSILLDKYFSKKKILIYVKFYFYKKMLSNYKFFKYKIQILNKTLNTFIMNSHTFKHISLTYKSLLASIPLTFMWINSL
jgi:hypothetical protein